MTRAGQLQVAGFAVVVFAIFSGITWYHVVKVGRYDVDKNVEYCRAEYHLNGEQALRLRVLEVEFHGRNKRFGFFMPEDGASQEHHLAISRLMDADNGARFLALEAGQVR